MESEEHALTEAWVSCRIISTPVNFVRPLQWEGVKVTI
jgi:hypothetical protein